MDFDYTIQAEVCDYVETHQNRLVEIICGLVRIPSENKRHGERRGNARNTRPASSVTVHCGGLGGVVAAGG
jgi:hypothetical protein